MGHVRHGSATTTYAVRAAIQRSQASLAQLSDRGFRRAIARMPKLGAYGPHIVHDHVMRGGDPAPVRRALAGGAVPVQKLRWNWSPEQVRRAGEVLDALGEP